MERARPELWRRTTIAIRRQLARAAKAAGAGKVQLSYAKVAEFQARGLVHFHAIFRLDATTHDGDLIPPALDAAQLAAVITVTSLEWDGMGWRTTGDALLALSAAARARDHDQAARDHDQAARDHAQAA